MDPATDATPPSCGKRQLLIALGSGAVGALGLLPGAHGPFDSVVLLAWLTLIAAPLGWLLGAGGAHRAALRVLAPAIWIFLLLETQLLGDAAVPQASLALAGIVAIYLCGLGLGGLFGHGAGESGVLVGAGGLLLGGMLLTLAPVLLGSGFSSADPARAPESPALSALLLDADPLVFVLESGGLDGSHRQPWLYARAGVEWIERRPWRGPLAPGLLLLLGWALAVAGARRVAQCTALPPGGSL